jgi:O-antigen ligase
VSAVAASLPATSRIRDSWERLSESPRARETAVFGALVAFAALWGVAVSFSAVGATLLAFSFIACLACLRDFRVGVALLILIMPISSSTFFPHAMFGMTGLNPLNLLLVATLAVFLMRAAGTDALKGFIPRPLYWLYIVPIAVAAVIGMQHVDEIPRVFKASDLIVFDNGLGYLRDVFFKPMGLVVYALLVAAAVSWSERPERFVIPMLISVFLMAGLAIGFVASLGVSLSELSGSYSRHIMGMIGLHPNDLGRLYAMAFALLLFVWDRTTRTGLKAPLVLAMGMVTLALLFTFSRGAFFGFVIVCLLYLLLRRSVKTLLLAAVLIPPAILFAPGALWSRLQAGMDAGLDEITAGRLNEIWIPILPEVLKTPPWGSGLESIMWSRAMRMEETFLVAHPHNAFLQVYMDLGVIGALLVLAFWFYTTRGFWRLSKDERLVPEMQGFFEGAAIGFVSFFIAGMAGSSFLPVPEQVYLWLAVGLMYGVHRHLARGAVFVGEK